VFFAVLFGCILASSLACVEDAALSASKALPGGWFEQDLDWDNGNGGGTVRDVAVELAQFALDHGEEVDDTLSDWKGRVPDVDSGDIQRVFGQVIAGMNYCIEFTIQHNHGGHENENGNGHGQGHGPRKLHCKAKVFKPLKVYE